jgi:hypothetical protein
MFILSSETELFGRHPEPAISNAESKLRSEIVPHWRLDALSREAAVSTIETEISVSSKGPSAQVREIIHGSTGSRIFQLLNQVKPSSESRPRLQNPASAPESSDPAGRKLKL